MAARLATNGRGRASLAVTKRAPPEVIPCGNDEVLARAACRLETAAGRPGPGAVRTRARATESKAPRASCDEI